MNRYNYRLFARIILIVIFSGIMAILLYRQWFWLALPVCGFLVWLIANLFLFQTRNRKDLIRLIEAIKFSEFNISFEQNQKKGLNPELYENMQQSIKKFDSKLTSIEVENHFYNTLLNRIDFGIIVVAQSGNINWINKVALDFFQKPQPRTVSDLKNISPELPNIIDELLPHNTETIKIEQKNAILHLAITAINFSLSGEQLKLISIKNIQTVLEKSEVEAWKKLIRVLTHEIMNSITPIISLSETFSEPNEENQEMLSRAMETIHRRSKGLVEFVHNYQKLSKIPNPVIGKFSAKELMEDILNLFKGEGLSFVCHIIPENLILSADRSQFEQVMINLIKNAFESSGQNTTPSVEVNIFLNNYHRPVIQVHDKGEGILPEVLDKIFIPFFTTKSKGSGIGLSICRQIVNLHGGNISVQSKLGEGSCFMIEL